MDIIEFLPDPTFVIDRAGTVIAWNRAIEALSGVPKEEMLGRGNDAYSVVFYGCERPLLIDLVISGTHGGLEAYTEVEAGTGTLVAEAFAPAWNDGTGVYLWGKASLLYTPDGEVAGAIESIRDITERKRTEQQASAERGEIPGAGREHQRYHLRDRSRGSDHLHQPRRHACLGIYAR